MREVPVDGWTGGAVLCLPGVLQKDRAVGEAQTDAHEGALPVGAAQLCGGGDQGDCGAVPSDGRGGGSLPGQGLSWFCLGLMGAGTPTTGSTAQMPQGDVKPRGLSASTRRLTAPDHWHGQHLWSEPECLKLK